MTMMGEAPKRKFARDEDLKVGDMVRVLGWKRITAIHKYTGPLTDIVFAIADTVPGAGFSLCYGCETEVA